MSSILGRAPLFHFTGQTSKATALRPAGPIRSSKCKVIALLQPSPGAQVTWAQDLNHVYIRTPLADGVRSRDVDLVVKRKRLSLSIASQVILEGSLENPEGVLPEDSYFEVESDVGGRVCVVTLVKAQQAPDLISYEAWPALLASDVADKTFTSQVFLELSIAGRVAGRVVVGLYGTAAPRTAANFHALCQGGSGATGTTLTYKGSRVFRVNPGVMIMAGQLPGRSVSGGDSIYGGAFEDENFVLRHESAGAVSMANTGLNTNTCHFQITLGPAAWLDGKHVVFGQVVEGLDLVRRINSLPLVGETPEAPVEVTACGVIPPDAHIPYSVAPPVAVGSQTKPKLDIGGNF